MEDVNEQFAQQQQLIEQLKVMVREKDTEMKSSSSTFEERLKLKEKELQDAASKLSHIKLQNKAKNLNKKQQSTPTKKSVSSPQSDTTPENPNRGKMVLLKKKLDENRQKFEKRDREMSESQKNIEQTVSSLKKQLEERDSVIDDLRNSNKEQVKTSDVNVDDLYAQVVYKDNKIMELNNQVLELERKVIDGQEVALEKDEVISARNKAIQLITEDLSRKSKTVVDDLDMTREQMRTMQQNFVAKESEWKQERNQLISALEKMETKTEGESKAINELEKKSEKLEAIRFELASKNAELQEKCVLAQENLKKQMSSSNSDVSELKVTINEKQKKVEELEDTLAATLKKYDDEIVKINQDHESKLQNYEEEMKNYEGQIHALNESLKENGDIAARYKLDMKDLEIELEKSKEEINSQMEVIDSLRANISSSNETKASLVENLQSQLESMETVHLEMKEENDNLVAKLQDKIDQIRIMEKEHSDTVSNLETELLDFRSSTKEEKDQLNNIIKEKDEEKVLLQQEICNLKIKIDDEHDNMDTISELQAQMDVQFNELRSLREKLNEKESELNEYETKIQEVNSESKELAEVQNAKIMNFEKELNESLQRQNSLEEELENYREKCNLQASEMSDSLENLEQMRSELKDMCHENENLKLDIAESDNKCKKLQSLLEDTKQEHTELINKFSNDEKMKDRIDELTLKLSESEEYIASQKSAMESSENDLQKIEAENSKLKSKIEENESEFVEWKQKYELLENEKEQLNIGAAKLQQDHDAFEKEKNSLMEEIDEMKNYYTQESNNSVEIAESMRIENKDLKDQLNLLSKELDSTNNTIFRINCDVLDESCALESVETLSDRLEMIVMNVCREQSVVKQNLKSSLQRNENLDQELQMLRSNIQEVESKNQEMIDDLRKTILEKDSAIESKNEELEHARIGAKNVSEEDESKLNKLLDKIREYESIVSQHDSIIEALNSELEAANTKLMEEKRKHQEMNERLSADSKSLENETIKKLEMIAELNDQVQNLSNRESLLHEKNEQYEIEVERLNGIASALQDEKETWNLKFNEMKDQIQYHENLCHSLRNELDDSSNDIKMSEAKFREKIDEVEEKLLKSNQQILQYESSYSELNDALNTKDLNIESLTDEKCHLNERIHKLNNDFERLKFYEEEYKKVVGQMNDNDQAAINAKEELVNKNIELNQLYENARSALEVAEKENSVLMDKNQALSSDLSNDASESQSLAEIVKCVCEHLNLEFPIAISDNKDEILNNFNHCLLNLKELSDQTSSSATNPESETTGNDSKMNLEEASSKLIASEEMNSILTSTIEEHLEKLSTIQSQNLALSSRIEELEESLFRSEESTANSQKVSSEYETRLQNLRMEKDSSDEVIEQLKCELQMCSTRVDQLESEIKSVQMSKDEEADDEMKNLMNDLDRIKDELLKVKESNRLLNDEREELEGLVRTERECANDLRKELQTAKSEIQNLEVKSEQSFSETSGWECEAIEPELVSCVERELKQGNPAEDSTTVIKELQEKYDTLSTEHKKTKSKSDRMLLKLKQFKDKNEKLSNANKELKSKVSDFEQKIKEQMDDVNKGKSMMSSSIEKQSSKIQSLLDEKNNLERKFLELESSHVTITATLDEKQRYAASIKDAKELLAQELENFRSKHDQLRIENEHIRLQLNHAVDEQQRKDEEINRMMHQLETEKNQHLDTKDQFSNIQSKLLKLEEHIQVQNGELQTFKYENEALKKNLESQTNSLKQLEDYRVKHEIVQLELEKSLRKIDDLQLQNDEANNRLGSFEASWTQNESEMSIELSELRMRVEQLTSKNAQLLDENSDLINKTAADVQNSAHRDRREVDDLRTMELERELSMKSKNLEMAEMDLLRRREDLEMWFDEANKRFDESRIAIEDLKKDVVDLSERNKNLESEKGNLLQKINGLNEEVKKHSSKNFKPAESSELVDLTIERLRAELQRAMESLHHKDMICEEMKDTIAQLQEEKYEYMSRSKTHKSMSEADVHTPPRSLNTTIIDIDDSQSDSSSNANNLSSNQRLTFIEDDHYDDIRNQLMVSEKDKVNLQAENTALNDALSMEQQRRHDIEVELKSIKQVMNLDFTSPSKSDYHMDFKDEAPLLYPETNHCLTRSFKSNTHKLKRWLKGRSFFVSRHLGTKSWLRLGCYAYILVLHIMYLTCIF